MYRLLFYTALVVGYAKEAIGFHQRSDKPLSQSESRKMLLCIRFFNELCIVRGDVPQLSQLPEN